MKLNALEYFITLSESRSINEAARKLYISQPSLTKALQLLEDEVGTQLFQRSSAGIVLTPAGKKMLPEAKQVMEYYRGWKNLAQAPALEKISIYSHFSFPDFLFPELLLQFRISHPELKIRFQTSYCPESFISRNVTSPVISMTVCRDNQVVERLTRIQDNPPITLLEGEYQCLVNSGSPLAKQEYVTPEELRDYFLITPNLEDTDNGTLISGMIQTLTSANPGSKHISVESASNVISIVGKNPHTYALSHYPSLQRYSQDNLVNIPFRGMHTKADLCLFYSADACRQHPVMQELIQAIQDAAAQFRNRVR